MAISFKTRFTLMILLEVLTVTVLALAIAILASKEFPLLTFDTSSVKTQFADQGISNGNIPDWYELHYLSVCKGLWQSGSPQLKNKTTTICRSMGGGYNFSLSQLLTADAGLPVKASPLLSFWDWAVLNTEMPFICLVIAIAFTSLTAIAYFITIVMTPDLTTKSPSLYREWANITSLMRKVLEAKQVKQDGIAWSTGGLYVLTWLATGLIIVMFVLSVVFALMVQPPTSSPDKEIKGKSLGYSKVR